MKKKTILAIGIIGLFAGMVFVPAISAEHFGHPFTDGNGRTCRIILNRELLSAGFYSIIIPTVFREDYLMSLRALSRKGRPSPIVRMVLRALKFSSLDFSNYQSVKKEIIKRNWFLEPDEGKIIE